MIYRPIKFLKKCPYEDWYFFVLLMFDCVGSNGSTINLIPVFLSLKLIQKLFQDTKQHVTKWIAGTAVTGGLYNS